MAAWLDVFNVEAVPIHGTAFDGIMLRQLRRAVDEYLDQHDAPAARRAARAIPITTTRGGSPP